MACVAPDQHGNLTEAMQWIPNFFAKKYNDLTKISNAAGVRERWLQGEMYLHVMKEEIDIQLEIGRASCRERV